MSVDALADVAVEGDGGIRCWCCGTSDAPSRMLQLGNHPEVHLCLNCAHFVHRQAWEIEDQESPGAAALVRDHVRGLRDTVVRRGWHDLRFIGGKVRWLDKHLP